MSNYTAIRHKGVQLQKARVEHYMTARQQAPGQLQEKKPNDDLNLKKKLATPWHLQSANKKKKLNIYRYKQNIYNNKRYNKCYNKSINTHTNDPKLYIWQAFKKIMSFAICFIWFIGFINTNKNVPIYVYILALFSTFMVMFFVNYSD